MIVEKQVMTPTRKKTVAGSGSRKHTAPLAKHRVRKARAATPRPRTLSRFLRILRAHLPELTARYHIKSLGIFGSYVRKDATKKSDLDLLIEFDEKAHLTLFGYAHLENELTDLLGIKVDLVDKDTVKLRILENVMREVVYAWPHLPTI